MMYQPYKCCVRSMEDYYVNQTGHGLTFYSGMPLQRGHGLGGLFRSLFRAAVPLLKSSAKAIGKQVLNSGASIVSDVMRGKELKAAAKERSKEAGKALVDKAAAKVKSMIGSGPRHKRKRKGARSTIRSKIRKVQASDIFSR